MTATQAVFSSLLLIVLTAVSFIVDAKGQSNDRSLDKIVAVVGKEVIFQSDVEGRTAIIAQQKKLSPNDVDLHNQVIEDLVNEKLIIVKAIEDSIEVSPDEVSQRLDHTIQNLVQTYGSERRIEDLYGMSIDRLRRNFRDEMKKQMMAERLQQAKLGSVKCSPHEVEEFYAQYKDSLPAIPSQASLSHIVIYVRASQAVKDDARRLAAKVRDSLLSGGKFGEFAKRYSADPGSAAVGGELGWVEKGKFVPEYEKVAYAMQPDEISSPVESPFGFHIIQLVERRSDAANTRHILFKIGASQDDNARVKDSLLSLKRRVTSGEDFETLAKLYSEEKETQGFGGSMGNMELSRLAPDVREVVEGLSDGGVSDPLPYATDPTKPAFHIILKKRVISEHAPTLEYDAKRIEQYAVVHKQTKMFEKWIQELRSTLYWELK